MTLPVTAEAVLELRNKTGSGINECRRALEWAKGDRALAHGYLRYQGCAIQVRPRTRETQSQAYDRWVEKNARDYAAKHPNP